MYKVGDKLVCKKNWSGNMTYSGLTINKEYIINGSNNNGAFRIGEYWFYTYCDDNIKDWFYTTKELRKKKLERLNNVV